MARSAKLTRIHMALAAGERRERWSLTQFQFHIYDIYAP